MKIGEMEDLVVIGGLIAVQFIYAGNSVLLSYLMSLGLNPLTVVICIASATFLFLSPLAAYFERSNWPKKLSFKLMLQLVLISFGGVTLFQTLLLEGIKLTSPAMASAMPNLAPGLIFIIAWCFSRCHHNEHTAEHHHNTGKRAANISTFNCTLQ